MLSGLLVRSTAWPPDTSVLVMPYAVGSGSTPWSGQHADEEVAISVATASELLRGVHRVAGAAAARGKGRGVR
jgi:hypothetical protein